MSLDPITAALDIGSKVIDRLWPDKASADKAKLELLQMANTKELAELTSSTDIAKAQIGVNEQEAQNSNFWVSGARPGILWVCGAAMAYSAIIEPLAQFTAMVGFGYTGPFPVLNTDLTMQLLFGILGLGAYRTVEKIKGVAR